MSAVSASLALSGCCLLDLGVYVARSILKSSTPLMRHMMLLSHEVTHPRRDAECSASSCLLPFPISCLAYLTTTLDHNANVSKTQKTAYWTWALAAALNHMFIGKLYGKVPTGAASEAQRAALAALEEDVKLLERDFAEPALDSHCQESSLRSPA